MATAAQTYHFYSSISFLSSATKSLEHYRSVWGVLFQQNFRSHEFQSQVCPHLLSVWPWDKRQEVKLNLGLGCGEDWGRWGGGFAKGQVGKQAELPIENKHLYSQRGWAVPPMLSEVVSAPPRVYPLTRDVQCLLLNQYLLYQPYTQGLFVTLTSHHPARLEHKIERSHIKRGDYFIKWIGCKGNYLCS